MWTLELQPARRRLLQRIIVLIETRRHSVDLSVRVTDLGFHHFASQPFLVLASENHSVDHTDGTNPHGHHGNEDSRPSSSEVSEVIVVHRKRPRPKQQVPKRPEEHELA
eukprot:TRINITY_DN8170_c0_g4_i3.p2 TRINITY_DN8170_c0_g4~~TRINITY_DN8170_c0_g4_i3.p2  ORF type:complete len:109 (+),score=1.39 TRINITY_DN8170_c0_g4_i3:259-585(+)